MPIQPETYQLEKTIWTHDDFEQMGWHDAHIYGLAIENTEDIWNADFLLDIDYIFKWVYPIPPQETFSFWVAPCTMIFSECYDLQIDFKTEKGCLINPIEIADIFLEIVKEGNNTIYQWHIALQLGSIKLKSSGLKQIVRKSPMHNGQCLTLNERGGINFGRTPVDL